MKAIENILNSNHLKQMSNIWIYIFLSITSVILIVIFHETDFCFSDILENISCSMIAAIAMAFFIDYHTLKTTAEETKKFRTMYFEEVNGQISIIVGHLLWFEEHLKENHIDCNLAPEVNLNNILIANNDVKQQEIPFDDAINRLEGMKKKYSNIAGLSEKESYKIKLMFQMFSKELEMLLIKMNKMNDDKIILEVKNYFKLKDIETLLSNANLCKKFLENSGNYGQGIQLLILTMEDIRDMGGYATTIKIGVHEEILDFNRIKLK